MALRPLEALSRGAVPLLPPQATPDDGARYSHPSCPALSQRTRSPAWRGRLLPPRPRSPSHGATAHGMEGLYPACVTHAFIEALLLSDFGQDKDCGWETLNVCQGTALARFLARLPSLNVLTVCRMPSMVILCHFPPILPATSLHRARAKRASGFGLESISS